MGNRLDRLGGYESDGSLEPSNHIVEDLLQPGTSSRKRQSTETTEANSLTKKVKKLDTTKYVYEKLFLQGEGSDITIHACGKVWNLHKFYLQQCKYFEAILNGNWKESSNNSIHIEINDEKVTAEGMHSVLASLYNNEIEIDLEKIEGTLAAAILIGLESVVSRCEDVMADNLSHTNVLRFHDIAERYGLLKVQKMALCSLKILFWKFMSNRKMLADLSESLLTSLLSSSELLVVEGEIDLYKMVRWWIYIHESPDAVLLDCDDATFEKNVINFLRESPENVLFVKYSTIFASLRIHHFLTLTGSIKRIEHDKLIPTQVINSISVSQWRSMLRNEENPLLINDLSDDDFNLSSWRLGRIIESFPKCWRWTGYNNGVDILLHITNYLLTMRRNCLNQSTPYSINLKSDRTIHYRIILMDANGKCLFDSEKKSVILRPDQIITVARLPDEMALPISVHLQYLAAEPPQPSLIFDLELLDAARKVIPRPNNLERTRSEDDKTIDQKPLFPSPNPDGTFPETIEGDHEITSSDEKQLGNETETLRKSRKAPFQRVQLKRKRDTPPKTDEAKTIADVENPFEEIVTRRPPNDYWQMQKLRKQHRKKNRRKRRKHKNGFLTRDDIIRTHGKQQEPSVQIRDLTREKAEFDHTTRNIAQETWERENKQAELVRQEMENGQATSAPIVNPVEKIIEEENGGPIPMKIQRLPNNPYKTVDIRKPTIISLPVPPLFHS
ncbi:unnamed protein product [Caenorhabditis bovis]|uniref:BTB domain-containing protein n=1 Tax=Caenorhabditis bovis TaxID=2654633 RepID=A0A8S1F3E9_9PELO|nr:unnamed protein product [Caenorhabditis bovis]